MSENALFYCPRRVISLRTNLRLFGDNHGMNDASLNVALKEWDVVCKALCSGKLHILLRKGGILEAAGEFELQHERFLLFPTFVHQQASGLKAPYREGISSLRAEPDTVQIPGWAQVQKIFRVPGRAQMDAINDLHIWDTPLIDMRFNYRPDYPLYLILVRAWILPHPVTVANSIEYAGCKSWVPLMQSVSMQSSVPVGSDETLNALQDRIAATFSHV